MQPAYPQSESRYRQTSFWLDSVPGTLQARPALPGDTNTDVAIVGAGYTGLWTAYYLKRHAPDLDVRILEAEIAGFGASGRNGGWCSGYLSGLEDQAGRTTTRASAITLQKLMNETVSDVGRVCDENGIDCHFEQSGHLAAAVVPAHLRRLREDVEFMHGLGFGEADYRWLSAEDVREQAHIEGALGGFHMSHCAALHPARLARGLAYRVENMGVRIHEHSPAVKLDGKAVHTPHGRLSAQHLLLATEGYTCRLPGLGRKLIPMHSTMVATEPLTEEQLDATGIRARFTFSDGNHVVTYGQLTADRRIAFGCRGSYLYGSGIHAGFDPANEVFRMVESELLRLFPMLRGVRFTHAWGGAMGVSRTLRPAVCYDRSSGCGWSGGYFGNGVAAAHLAGRTMADLLLGRDTERSRALWVNPPGESGLSERLWEPEPLRWLGVAARSRLMHRVDRAEHRESTTARPLNWCLEHLFP